MEKFSRTDIAIVKRIKGSQQPVTILFTDIEDSSRLWRKEGDVRARLLVDRLNRLLFPVIKRFNGRVIKTIGDSIMAAFTTPRDAVRAAIAMQQMIERERAERSSFDLKIRIGIHSGEALVEDDDVYGDVVNIASWIESVATGGEILISEECSLEMSGQEYSMKYFGRRVPKGKRGKIKLYSCQWRESDSLIEGIERARLISVIQKQKLEIVAYLVITLLLAAALYHSYFRYLIADNTRASLWLQDPTMLPQESLLMLNILLISLVLVAITLYRMKRVPLTLFRILKGISIAAITLSLYMAVIYISDWKQEKYWNEALYSSEHLFVEVVAERAAIREKPGFESNVLFYADQGDLMLQNDTQRVGETIWNRVLIGRNAYGWLVRALPATENEAEHRVSYSSKFYFRYYDLYGWLLMIPAFIWGYRRFHMRPV